MGGNQRAAKPDEGAVESRYEADIILLSERLHHKLLILVELVVFLNAGFNLVLEFMRFIEAYLLPVSQFEPNSFIVIGVLLIPHDNNKLVIFVKPNQSIAFATFNEFHIVPVNLCALNGNPPFAC